MSAVVKEEDINWSKGSFFAKYKLVQEKPRTKFNTYSFFVCKNLQTRLEYFVKIFDKNEEHEKGKHQKVLTSMYFLNKVDHPNSLRTYDLYKEDDKYYIVVTLLQKSLSLRAFLQEYDGGILPEPIAAKIIN